MRTGEESPLYVDMRVLWSYPELAVAVSELMWQKCLEVAKYNEDGETSDLHNYSVCGLPYQGIPLASFLCTNYRMKMILKRQEVKKYGTCHLLEGCFKKGDKVILVDDILMTGGTLIDNIPIFEKEGLDVAFGVVFIDREQGGKRRIEHLVGKKVYSIFGMTKVLSVLLSSGKIDQQTFEKTKRYLEENRFDTSDYGVTNDPCSSSLFTCI